MSASYFLRLLLLGLLRHFASRGTLKTTNRSHHRALCSRRRFDRAIDASRCQRVVSLNLFIIFIDVCLYCLIVKIIIEKNVRKYQLESRRRTIVDFCSSWQAKSFTEVYEIRPACIHSLGRALMEKEIGKCARISPESWEWECQPPRFFS